MRSFRSEIGRKTGPGRTIPGCCDEAIYGLASDSAADIFDAFYGPRAHSVTTFDSMAPYREIIMTGGMGGGGDGASAVRSEFPDTSAWLPVSRPMRMGRRPWRSTCPITPQLAGKCQTVTLDHQVGQTATNIETKKMFCASLLLRCSPMETVH
jgi:hypothetical protein